jgi:hypothetical protein
MRVGDQRLLFSHWTKVPYGEPAGTTTVAAITTSSFLKTTVRFAKFTALIATVALTAAVASNNARGATVRAHGYVLQLNGAPFVIKGMNYSPVPIGAAPRYRPYGDYFIPYYANVWRPDLDTRQNPRGRHQRHQIIRR